MKLGIFGGTFNPIHTGHVNLARRCAEALGLDEVLLIPTSMPPHKDGAAVADGRHRLEMCRLAVRALPGLSVSGMELERGGKSYTVDTLRLLRVARPGDELALLMGSDMFYSLPDWRCADEVLRLAEVVAVAREEDESARLTAMRDRLIAMGGAARVVELDPIVTSSTEIRAGDKGETLPPPVEAYINQNGLYGRPVELGVDVGGLSDLLRERLSDRRLAHTLYVASEAVTLARVHGVDPIAAYVAGLLHDLCKEMDPGEMLKILEGSDIIQDKTFMASQPIWHGRVAAIFARDELMVLNAQILDAVRYHSTGRADMSPLERVVYMADLVSAERNYPGVAALRALARKSLDDALYEAFQFAVGDLISRDLPILKETFEAYNQLVLAREG